MVLMAFFKINICCIDVGAADPQDTIPNLDDMQKCMVCHWGCLLFGYFLICLSAKRADDSFL